MDRRDFSKYSLALGMGVLLSGCRKKAPGKIDPGTVDGDVYRNGYFGLTITFPSGWNIQDRESCKQIMDMGAEAVTGDGEILAAIRSDGELQSVNLVAAFEHPPGTDVPYNQNFACIAERVRDIPEIKRGKGCHLYIRKLLEASDMGVSFPQESSTEKIGGVDFDVMGIEMSMGGLVIRQKHYTAIRKGYALSLIASSAVDGQKGSLQKILDSVTFK